MAENENAYEIIGAAIDIFEENENITVLDNNKGIEIKNIFSQYNLISHGIITMFCEKHGIKFSGWVDGVIGGVAMMGRDIINFCDIKYDVETNQPINHFFKWYDTSELDYVSWCENVK
jgi:DNA gyrase/topoisomerase IV subunit B